LTDFTDVPRGDLADLAKARKDGNDFALISCVSKALSASPQGQALKLHAGQPALLAADGDNWKMVATEPFRAATAPEKWTTELSPGPFCR
jgi:mannose-6-phosphate isomerase class I